MYTMLTSSRIQFIDQDIIRVLFHIDEATSCPDTKSKSLINANATIYDLTDGGTINTDMIRHPGTPHSEHDQTFIRFRAAFDKAPVSIRERHTPKQIASAVDTQHALALAALLLFRS